MTEAAYIEKELSDIPLGGFEIRRHSAGGFEAPAVMPVQATTCGKGRVESYPLFPGIELSFHRYRAEQVRFRHEAAASVLEVNYCRTGRAGWNMRGVSIYLGAGDLCIHSMAQCADSEMILPLGYYEGAAVTFDLAVLKKNCPPILAEAGFDAEAVHEKFCAAGRPIGIPSGSKTDAIFPPLYDTDEGTRIACYKLKALELLLYLLRLEPTEETGLTQYRSQQTAMIKEIRNLLIDNLDKRFTIEELSRLYLINTSSLKALFKAVYGAPIAAYVKECRIDRAKKLLRETDDSIAAIAERVGYETQGKFSKAFKQVTGILPTEYRRQHTEG